MRRSSDPPGSRGGERLDSVLVLRVQPSIGTVGTWRTGSEFRHPFQPLPPQRRPGKYVEGVKQGGWPVTSLCGTLAPILAAARGHLVEGERRRT